MVKIRRLQKSIHRSVGLDLRTEKSGFFAIWTGFGLDLTSFTGLWISTFGMDCQSNPSHPTLKQEHSRKVIWNKKNFQPFLICDTVNFIKIDKKTRDTVVYFKLIGLRPQPVQPLDLIVELDWTEMSFRMLDLIVELIDNSLDWT